MIIPYRKQIRGSIYFRAALLPTLIGPIEYLTAIETALAKYPACNIVRITKTQNEFSLLFYAHMDRPHPELREAHLFRKTGPDWTEDALRKYGKNCMILHRVELLYARTDSEYAFHRAITEFEESRGILQIPGIGAINTMKKTLSRIPKSEIPPALHYLLG
jgi:hypothetical protein